MKSVRPCCWIIFSCVLFVQVSLDAQKDAFFYSRAFGTERWYRIYPPPDYYESPQKRYPVVYSFHGWGGRYKWDNYKLEDDPGYPENGRRKPPFVMEWKSYTEPHDLIIVTWDGYEPNLHQGRFHREGIDYGGCNPYDFPRAHEDPIVHWGWDFRKHFRDQVSHIDSNYHCRAGPQRGDRIEHGRALLPCMFRDRTRTLSDQSVLFVPLQISPGTVQRAISPFFPSMKCTVDSRGFPCGLQLLPGTGCSPMTFE